MQSQNLALRRETSPEFAVAKGLQDSGSDCYWLAGTEEMYWAVSLLGACGIEVLHPTTINYNGMQIEKSTPNPYIW